MYKSLNLSFVLAYRALSSINEDVCNLKSTAIILAVSIILIKLITTISNENLIKMS